MFLNYGATFHKYNIAVPVPTCHTLYMLGSLETASKPSTAGVGVIDKDTTYDGVSSTFVAFYRRSFDAEVRLENK